MQKIEVIERKLFFFLLLLLFSISVKGQALFEGRFLMSTYTSDVINANWPLRMHIDRSANYLRIAIEIEDDMIQKGVNRKVIFNTQDSTWTMTTQYNQVRVGSRIRATSMFRDSVYQKKLNQRWSGERRKIEGLECRKMMIESDTNIAELWITQSINFDFAYTYNLLNHCGLMNELTKKGDWFYMKQKTGMILEVTSKNKFTGDSYSLKINALEKGAVNNNLFDLTGFKISDIPEGYNCGLPEKGN